MLRGPQHKARAAKSELAISPLPSGGHKRYVTLAFSGIPNAKCGELNPKCSPTKGNKRKAGCLTHAFARAQKRAKMLCYPCIPGDPQRQARGEKAEMVPNQRAQNHMWLPHPCLFEGPKEGRNAHPCILMGPQHQVRGTNSEMLASPPLSRGPKRGRKCYITRAFPGVCTRGQKIRADCLTRAFLAARKRAEMLSNPCILSDPQHQARGAKSEVVANKRAQNQKWLLHPCLDWGRKEGRNATSPLHCWRSPTKREKM